MNGVQLTITYEALDSNTNENNEAHDSIIDTDTGPFGSSSGKYN